MAYLKIFKSIFLYVQHIVFDPMHQNSLYLMVSTLVMGASGFGFWLVVSHSYPPEVIGISGSLISISGLICSFSVLGFPQSIVRFLSKSEKPEYIIGSSLTITGIVAVLFSTLFWFASIKLFPELHQIIGTPLRLVLFSAIILVTVWDQIVDSIFLAFGESKWILVESLIFSVAKIVFLMLLLKFGTFGVYASNYGTILIPLVIDFLIIKFRYKIPLILRISKKTVTSIAKYTTSSYLVGVVSLLPSQVLPALVVSRIGAESAAHFFVAQMMVNILLIIPQASSQTLFAEASKEFSTIRYLSIKSIKLQVILSALCLAFIWILGATFLGLFGSKYTAATLPTLKILSVGVVPVIFSYPFSVRLRIKKNLKALSLTAILGTITILATSYIGSYFGLSGVATGYVLGQTVILFILVLNYLYEKSKASNFIR